MIEIEFSRPVLISKMGKAGLEYSIEATPEECAALATRLGLVALKSLKAEVRVKHWRKGGAHLIAHATGSLVQNCVVTLEDFEQVFAEDVEVQYADPRDKILIPDVDDGELILDAEGDDPPEMLENDRFDAGEAIAQQLVLSLDPYPRKPGVEFDKSFSKREETSPFDVLAALKTGPGEGSEED